jgi:hypothetical protein
VDTVCSLQASPQLQRILASLVLRVATHGSNTSIHECYCRLLLVLLKTVVGRQTVSGVNLGSTRALPTCGSSVISVPDHAQ